MPLRAVWDWWPSNMPSLWVQKYLPPRVQRSGFVCAKMHELNDA